MKQSIVKRLFVLMLIPVLLLSFVACGSGELRPNAKANKVVAKAGDVEILYDELYYLAKNKADILMDEYGEDALSDPDVREELESFVWDNLLTREHALISVGMKYGVRVDKGELADNIAAVIESNIEYEFEGDRDAYAEKLNEQYLTDRYFRTFYYGTSFELLPTAIVKAMMEGENQEQITNEEALEIIEKDFVRTVHIVIKRDNGKSDAENLVNATTLAAHLAAIRDDNERYAAMKAAIGGEYNNDYSDLTGAGYYFCRGQKKEAYEEVAFDLEEYETSSMVEVEGNYCIMMRLPQDPEYVKANLSSLMDGVYLVKMNGEVDTCFEEMTLEKTRFGESLDLCNLPEIDADGGEGLYIAIWITAGVVAVAGTVFVVRVMLNKRRHGTKARGKNRKK